MQVRVGTRSNGEREIGCLRCCKWKLSAEESMPRCKEKRCCTFVSPLLPPPFLPYACMNGDAGSSTASRYAKLKGVNKDQ